MNLDNKMSVKWDIETWIFKAQLMKLKTAEFSCPVQQRKKKSFFFFPDQLNS